MRPAYGDWRDSAFFLLTEPHRLWRYVRRDGLRRGLWLARIDWRVRNGPPR